MQWFLHAPTIVHYIKAIYSAYTSRFVQLQRCYNYYSRLIDNFANKETSVNSLLLMDHTLCAENYRYVLTLHMTMFKPFIMNVIGMEKKKKKKKFFFLSCNLTCKCKCVSSFISYSLSQWRFAYSNCAPLNGRNFTTCSPSLSPFLYLGFLQRAVLPPSYSSTL